MEFALYVYLQPGSKRRWEKAKHALGLTVTQDSDDEGVLRMDDLPSEPLAETLRRLLGLRKSVRPSDKQRASLARGREISLAKTPVPAAHIAATEEGLSPSAASEGR